MGKKAILIAESVSEERLVEADFYARRCGLPRDEVLQIIESAYSATGFKKQDKSKHRKRSKR
ncbi:hypothetical protein FJ414_21310 [Mesorhizobium sp. B3-1-6]|uniref:hypothetical protein n=1 Tax=Mesorhizobium sp. B3-1-6 TaxID=2589895 RepID=UPI0011262F18|nr:hypothetical protein [Mesorhizobium sp. B3-1-6]TPI32618.1 hypothetical protein FJ414_21310 [Mesorhizobium sp. B3-1-6]